MGCGTADVAPSRKQVMAESSKLNSAAARLRAAIDACEGTLKSHEGRLGTIDDLKRDIDELAGQKSDVSDSLNAANARITALKQTQSDVSGRLDSVIETIRTVVESK